MEIRPALAPYVPLARMLAQTFGQDCEVVLHDLAAPERSVVYVANPSVTGWKPITILLPQTASASAPRPS